MGDAGIVDKNKRGGCRRFLCKNLLEDLLHLFLFGNIANMSLSDTTNGAYLTRHSFGLCSLNVECMNASAVRGEFQRNRSPNAAACPRDDGCLSIQSKWASIRSALGQCETLSLRNKAPIAVLIHFCNVSTTTRSGSSPCCGGTFKITPSALCLNSNDEPSDNALAALI